MSLKDAPGRRQHAARRVNDGAGINSTPTKSNSRPLIMGPLLLLAILLIAAIASLATARAAETASCTGTRELTGVVPAPFGNDTRATADQPLHRSAASWARFDLRVGHLLALLKTASAGIALVFACWHRESSSFNAVPVAIIRGGICILGGEILGEEQSALTGLHLSPLFLRTPTQRSDNLSSVTLGVHGGAEAVEAFQWSRHVAGERLPGSGRRARCQPATGREVFSDRSFQNDRVRRPSNVAQRVIAALFDPVSEASCQRRFGGGLRQCFVVCDREWF